MPNVALKSRAKRIITVQLPASAQSPRFPLQSATVRRSKIVKHRAEPVANDELQRFGPVLTILPGESVEVPADFLKLEPLKNAIAGRELVNLGEVKPTPQPKFTHKKRAAKARK